MLSSVMTRYPKGDGHCSTCLPVVGRRVANSHLVAPATATTWRRWHQWTLFHCWSVWLAVSNERSFSPASVRYSADGLGRAAGEGPGSESVVSCTWPGGHSPSNYGCSTSLRSFPSWTTVFVARHTTWQFVTAHRRRPASRRTSLCTSRLCVCGAADMVSAVVSPPADCHVTAPSTTESNALSCRLKYRQLRLKPKSLAQHDDGRPDGLSLLPWSNGKCLA